MKSFIPLLSLAMLFVACHKSDDSTTDPEPEPVAIQRTVIVYMAGENNLDTQGFLSDDLNELVSGSKDVPASGRLVAFVDRASTRQKPYIVEIRNGVCDTIMQYQEDFYACDPDRFTNIINTIKNRYAAPEYGLVLWGHATGWIISRDSIASKQLSRTFRAYGCDTGNNSSASFGERWMNITQMARAMKQLPHFKYIFSDCCCMMGAEVAYELRDAADYLIGSPAEIPGGGAPYHLIVKDLFSTDNNFYRDLIDQYFNYYQDVYRTPQYANDYLYGQSVPLSVIDLSQMQELADATAKLLRNPQEFVTDKVPFYYGYDYPMMYDMGCMLKQTVSTEEYETWKKALDKAVPYKLFSAKWMSIYKSIINGFDSFNFNESNYSGLSMFVPKSEYNFITYSYNETFPNTAWYKAVEWERFAK